jgi:hypothetical protein
MERHRTPIQINVNPEDKRKIQIWCKEHDLSVSVYLRMVIKKTLENYRSIPGWTKEPTRQINVAVGDIQVLLPAIIKQREISKKIY